MDGPDDEDALPPGVEPWQAWATSDEVPKTIRRILLHGPGFGEVLKRAGISDRDESWFDAQIAVWRVKRAVRSVREGTAVWQDLMDWFLQQVRYEAKGAVK